MAQPSENQRQTTIYDNIRNGILFILFAGVTFSISVSELSTALLFFATIAGIILYKEKIPNTVFHYGFLLLLLTALLAVAVSSDMAANVPGIRKYWRVILPTCVMMTLVRKNMLFAQLNVLCFFVSIIALYGILQYFTGLSLTGTNVYLYDKSSLPLRWHAVGTFSIHHTYVGVLLLILPVFLSALYSKSVSGKKKGVYLFCSLLIIAAIVFSLSRGGWFSTLIAIFAVLILNKRKIESLLIIPVTAGLAAVYFYAAPNAGNILLTRLTSMFEGSDRIKMFKAAFMVIKDYFWFGIGPNTIDPLEQAYEIIAQTMGSTINSASVGVHNLYLQLILNYGIFHLLAFLLLWLGIFIAGINAINRKSAESVKETFVLKGILAGFLGSLSMGMLENNFYDGEVQLVIMLWIGVSGFIIYRIRNYKVDRL